MSYVEEMAQVEKDLRYMSELGAPAEDIKRYMQERGVTMANLRQYESVKDSLAAPKEKPSVLARFGRGMADIAMGAGQLTGQEANVKRGLSYLPGGIDAGALSGANDKSLINEESADVKRYEQAVGPGVDWMRIAGQATATSPLGFGAAAPTGLLARTAAGAALGGTGGASVYADDPNERLMNTVGGGLLGGAFSAVAPAVASGAVRVVAGIGRGVRTARNMVRKLPGVSQSIVDDIAAKIGVAADNAGVNLDELGESYVSRVAARAREALDNNQPFDYDAAIRAARAERFGFADDAAMTYGQASRDPTIFSQEQNLAKQAANNAPEAGPLADRLNAQQALAQSRIGDYPTVDPVQMSEELAGVVSRRAEEMQEGVRAAYAQIRGGGNMPREALANRTAQIIDDFGDSIPASVRSRIASLIDPDSTRAFTGDELIKLDKLITDNMPHEVNQGARNLAAGRLKEAVMGVMDDAAEEAPSALRASYRAAKDAARSRFEALGPQSGLVSKLSTGLERIDPTQVAPKIVKGQIRDIRRLHQLLGGLKVLDVRDCGQYSGQKWRTSCWTLATLRKTYFSIRPGIR
jgi:hypothetical protein